MRAVAMMALAAVNSGRWGQARPNGSQAGPAGH